MSLNHPDRLFSSNPINRDIAKEIFAGIETLPIISPHGHCDPSWFSENKRFPDPAQLFVVPDHYVFRMLVSQGISMKDLGIRPLDNSKFETDPRKIWRKFAENYHLFRGTPTKMWLDYLSLIHI